MDKERIEKLDKAWEVYKEWLLGYGRGNDSFSFGTWLNEQYKNAKKQGGRTRTQSERSPYVKG